MKPLIFIFIPMLIFLRLWGIAAQQQDFVLVAVVNQPVQRGTVFTPDLINSTVEIAMWPVELAPFNSISDMQELVGKVARVDMPVRTPLLLTNLVEDTSQTGQIGSDIALFTPPGALAIPIDISLLANFPHERFACVDVIATLDTGNDAMTTFTIGEGAHILEIAENTITVSLLPEDAVTLVWMEDNRIPLHVQFSDKC